MSFNGMGFLWGHEWPWDSIPRFWERILEMFGTIFGQSRNVFEIDFGLGTDCLRVLLCVLVFWAIYGLEQRFDGERKQNGSLP